MAIWNFRQTVSVTLLALAATLQGHAAGGACKKALSEVKQPGVLPDEEALEKAGIELDRGISLNVVYDLSLSKEILRPEGVSFLDRNFSKELWPLLNGDGVVGQVEFRSAEIPEKLKYVYGRVKVVPGPESRLIYQVETQEGVTHRFDPVYVWCRLKTVKETPAALKTWIHPTDLLALDLVDPLFLKRQAWAKKLLRQNKNPAASEDYYQYFVDHPGEAERLLKRWYGLDTARSMVERVRSYHPRLIPLLTDPGISNRLEKFSQFLQRQSTAELELPLISIRAAFSDVLGVSRSYRGMVLTSRELETIMQQGIKARTLLGGAKKFDEAAKALAEYTSPMKHRDEVLYPRSPVEAIEKKYSSPKEGQDAVQSMISVSRYREIAAAVGYIVGSHTSSRKLYVFDLVIPEIDVWRRENLFARPPSASGEGVIPYVLGNEVFDFYDEGIEQFIPYSVPSTAIQSVEHVTVKPPDPLVPFTPSVVENYQRIYKQQYPLREQRLREQGR